MDAFNVAKLQRKTLNIEYLRTWAADLGIQDLLERILRDTEGD